MDKVTAFKRTSFEKTNLDGFLVFNPSNLVYFTGLSRVSALLIPRDGEGTIYVYGVDYEQARATGIGFRAQLVKRSENLMEKIANQAIEKKMKSMAIDSLGVESWRILARKTRGKTKLTINPNLVSQLRAVKDPEEIALIRRACELASQGMKTAYEVASSGMKEYEMAAEIEYSMRKHGSYGTAFDTAVSSGLASAFPHGGCGDREIQTGELVVIDLGAVYKNYRSDITRTLVIGRPSAKQQKLHRIVREAQEKAFTAMKPGVKTKDIDAVARKMIEAEGYGENFVHGLGHGVGLDVHEPPTLNTISKEKLEVGNVITNEPGIYLVGFGGVRIEDTVLVTEDGAERLTNAPCVLGFRERH